MSEPKWSEMTQSQRRDAVVQMKAAFLIVAEICKKAPDLEVIATTLTSAEALAGWWCDLDDERQRLQRRVDELERSPTASEGES